MGNSIFGKNFAVIHGPARLEPLERRRLLSAGLPDLGFGKSGMVTGSGLAPGQAMAVQSNGQIVVAGTSKGQVQVTRYNYDGTLDTSFGASGTMLTNPGGTTTVSGVAIDDRGRVIVVGTNTVGTNSSDFIVLRYKSNGRLDNNFNSSGIAITSFGGEDTANSVMIEPGDVIVVAGTKVDTASGQSYFALARFTSSGALDSSFGTGGEVLTSFSLNAQGQAVTYDAKNGDIVVAGTMLEGSGGAFGVALYTADGSPDDGFNSIGQATMQIGTLDAGAAVAVLSGGEIVVGGTADNAGTLVAFSSDGSTDSNFGNSGEADLNGGNGATGSDTSGINSLALESDGKLLAGGFYTSSGVTDFDVARFTTSGNLDATFGSTHTPNGQPMALTAFADNSGASALALSPDGRIVAAGGATHLDLERLLNDVGGTDTTAPTSALSSAGKLRRATTRPYQFTVTYSDNVAVNAATLSDSNILVTSGGFSADAELVSVSPAVSDPSLVVTYEIAAPRRGFRARNNGVYTITLQRRQVRDTAGNAARSVVLGTFTVNIR